MSPSPLPCWARRLEAIAHGTHSPKRFNFGVGSSRAPVKEDMVSQMNPRAPNA
jgi:hypothetical protein